MCVCESLRFLKKKKATLRLELTEGVRWKHLRPVSRPISSHPMSCDSFVTISFKVTPCMFAAVSTFAYVNIRQHTSAYVIVRQHTSSYVRIRQDTSGYLACRDSLGLHSSSTASTASLSLLPSFSEKLSSPTAACDLPSLSLHLGCHKISQLVVNS